MEGFDDVGRLRKRQPGKGIYVRRQSGIFRVPPLGALFCSNGIGWSPDDKTM